MLGEPVSQEMIKLNESDSGQLLDYFKINKPEQTGDNLLAVIWDSEHEGRYEMAYSSLFEDTNQPGPILMIYFPQNQPDMAVISSENKDLQYIHYRVVGYRKNQIVTLMEQNYINGGEIEVLDGALKESRLVPGYPGKIVTHYIPYQPVNPRYYFFSAKYKDKYRRIYSLYRKFGAILLRYRILICFKVNIADRFQQ